MCDSNYLESTSFWRSFKISSKSAAILLLSSSKSIFIVGPSSSGLLISVVLDSGARGESEGVVGRGELAALLVFEVLPEVVARGGMGPVFPRSVCNSIGLGDSGVVSILLMQLRKRVLCNSSEPLSNFTAALLFSLVVGDLVTVEFPEVLLVLARGTLTCVLLLEQEMLQFLLHALTLVIVVIIKIINTTPITTIEIKYVYEFPKPLEDTVHTSQ